MARKKICILVLESRLQAKNQCSEYIFIEVYIRFLSYQLPPESFFLRHYYFFTRIFSYYFIYSLYNNILQSIFLLLLLYIISPTRKQYTPTFFFLPPPQLAEVLLRFSGCTILGVAYSNEPCCVSVPNQPNSLPTPLQR